MTRIVMTLLLCLFFTFLRAQADGKKEEPVQLPEKYLDKIDAKTDLLEQRLNAKSKKVLAKFQKEETRLRKKLEKIDSIAAKNIFSNSIKGYKQLEAELKNSGKLVNYIPRLDTVITSFKFLEQNTQLLSGVKDSKEKLSQSLSKIKELENQLQLSEDIKQFLKERRQFLKEQLQKFGLTKELKKINKEVYYYSQQVTIENNNICKDEWEGNELKDQAD